MRANLASELWSPSEGLYAGAYSPSSTPDVYILDPQTAGATFVSTSSSTPSAPGVAGFWGLAPTLAVPTYTYTTLNDALGTNGTFPFDINDVGQIVGVFQDSNNIQHGFLYSNGTYTTLNDPSAATPNGVGGLGTYANSINGSGQIVGLYADGTGVNHGFLYSGGTNGTYSTLDDPSASGAGTVTFGINDSGQIVGYSYTRRLTAFLYSGGTNGTYTTHQTSGTSSGLFTSPLGINDSGQIVGYYRDGNGNNQGFLDSNGTFTTLTVPGASGTNTVPAGINNAGQIVGYYVDSSGVAHAFLYSGGTYTTLDNPSATPGGTRAVGINDSVRSSAIMRTSVASTASWPASARDHRHRSPR